MKNFFPIISLLSIFVIIFITGCFNNTSTHNFSDEYSYDNVAHYHKCLDSDCNYVSDYKKHTYESVITKEATYDEEGIITYTCTVCGYSYTDKISKLSKENVIISNISDISKVYDGKEIDDVTYEISNNEAIVKISYKSDDEDEYTLEKPVNAGNYVVKITVLDENGFNATSVTKEFEISKATPTYKEEITLEGTYDKTKTLADYDISLYNLVWKDENIIPTCDVKTYIAIYNPDNDNYNDLEVEVTLVLEKATPTFDNEIVIEATYSDTQTLADFSLSGYRHLYWKDDEITPTCDIKTYKAIYNPDSLNYNDLEVDITIKLSKATPKYSIPTNLSAVALNKLSTITLPDNFSWVDENITLTADISKYYATYTPDDIINYEVITNIEITVKVSKIVVDLPKLSKSFVYNNCEYQINLSDITNYDDSYMKISDDSTLKAIDAGTYYIILEVSDTTNMIFKGNVKSYKLSWNITKADPIFSEDITLTGTYDENKTLADYVISIYSLSWKDETIIPTCDNTSYIAIYNPDSLNYNDLEVDVTINLSKATPTYELSVYYGIIGNYVSSINLDDGFSFEDESLIIDEGENEVTLTYIPEDTTNYNVVNNITTFIYGVANIVTKPTLADNISYTYDKSSHTYDLSNIINYDEEYMEISSDSVLSATDVGTYKITITLKNKKNNCYDDLTTDDITVTWYITKADPIFSEDITLTGTYDENKTLADYDISIYGLVWKDETLTPTCDNTSYVAIYNPDSLNYNDLEVEITIILEKTDPSYEIPTTLSGNVGETLSTITLPDNFSWEDGNTIIAEDVKEYSAIYTPNDNINYNIVNLKISINLINPIDYPFTITYSSGTANAYNVKLNDNGEYTITFTAITEDSLYQISGTLNGNIVIDIDETDTYKLELELCGITISSAYEAPISILSGDKVILTAKKNYDNYINDNRSAATDDEISSAVYSVVDLNISGKGSLTIYSLNNNGIHTKDDLKVKNLTLFVNVVDNALKGNDSVTIESGTLTLISRQGDGIKTSNSAIKYEDDGTTIKKIQGTVTISGGTINIYAACDGIDAAYNVEINDDAVTLNIYTSSYSSYSEEVSNIKSGIYYIRATSSSYKYSIYYYNSSTDYVWKNSSGYTTKTVKTTQQSGNMGGMGGLGGMNESTSTTYYYYEIEKPSGYSNMIIYVYSSTQTQGSSSSYYRSSGQKTVTDNYDTIIVTLSSFSPSGRGRGGSSSTASFEFSIYDSENSTKGIKADNEVIISGGTIEIKSYDDGIHVNNDVTLDSGSYGTGNVTITGGIITITTKDDGIHADQDIYISDNAYINVLTSYEGIEANRIYISGGEVYVYATDDGINAAECNGSYTPLLYISGGYVDVAVGSGDTDTIDSNGNVTITGGTVIVKNAQTSGSSMTGGTIDLDGTLKVTGGIVISVGCWCSEANMSSNASSTSTTLSSGTYYIKNSSGTIIETFTLSTSYKGYKIYIPGKSGTYYLYCGSTQITTL